MKRAAATLQCATTDTKQISLTPAKRRPDVVKGASPWIGSVAVMGVIERNESVPSVSIAAKRRYVVAMGASPWFTNDTARISPAGTKGIEQRKRPFAPSGLSFSIRTRIHGLAPMATSFRPFGTRLNDREVLNHAGSIQKKVADQLALEHFDAYSAELRRIEATEPTSDFDRFVDGVKKIKPPRKEPSDE